ncbi:MAG: C4-dicarboxylate ABC transporter [Pelagibacteraceae bacterium TMED65]|nr:C4-dicarboxylate ABC transporter [Rickettsiales bacterium]OUU53143.1 MAG: C4-dicarboxylate ABC transporter [Pelagibacteraceae bacterium TMED65]|tara:strand:+ start:1043 stop:2422 length:1380 start_codon:yes stop_codon:yes gene_type:complete
MIDILSQETFAFLLFFLLAIFLITGYPVALTLAGTAIFVGMLGYLLDLFPLVLISVLPNRIFGIITNETLIAVPLFIFMGVMLEKSGIANDLLENMSKIWGKKRGGLVYSILIVGVLMAASTGIVGATVVTMGILSLPLMIKWKYNRKISTGVICASGTLGQIIPPSIVLVLLADIFQGANEQASAISGNLAPDPVSSIDLFAGAIFPGVLLVGMYFIWIFICSKIKPDIFPKAPFEGAQFNIFKILKTIFPPIILIIIVLGSILFGVATPTESASLGALGSILISLKKKDMNIDTILKASKETVKISSMVFFILIGASLFSLVFRGFGGDLIVENFISGVPGGAIISFTIVMLIIFLLGFFLDFFQIVFVIVPIVGPSLIAMGYDPIWLALMFAINLQTSFLTPPFGFALFYLRGVSPKEVKTSEIYQGVIPFIIIQILLLLILFKFPSIITWLPRQL